MSMYRVYDDGVVRFVVSSDGILKKHHRWLDEDTLVEEFQPVPMEELTEAWNDIVSRMVNKARKEEQDRIMSNIKNVLLLC